jgi:beta-lactamase superfamily II metal-dependent hydrolase
VHSSGRSHSLRIVVVACGHGDTILVEFDRGRWALVDCYLRDKGVHDHFFKVLRNLRIRRLDYLFLTHPHLDHYHGMADVVTHFTKNGRGIGVFCDVGVNPADVVQILRAAGRPKRHIREYVRLVRLLDPLFKRDIVDYQPISVGFYPLSRGSTPHSSFIPVGPRSGLAARLSREALAGQRPSHSLNSLSIQLLLRCVAGSGSLLALLAADADTADVDRALSAWRDHRENSTHGVAFDLIKVPHHGSRKGHSSQLCKARSKTGHNIAVISADVQYRLPKRGVIEEYQKEGWRTLCTTTRYPPSARRTMVLSLFSRGPKGVFGSRRQDIDIRWSEKDGLTWSPKGAEIPPNRLAHFYP